METTLKINDFAMVCKSQRKANEFIKKLDALCNEFQKEKGASYFEYHFEQ